ncbi:MAG: hypothetical protein RJQ14_14270 [Marinoscillum sp.]
MLRSELNNFLSNISGTQSVYYQLATYLNNHKKHYLPTLKESFMGSTLIMGDLTGPSDNGWKLNYPTGFSNSIKLPEMPSNIDTLISREGMRNVATAYEILESFLYDVTAAFLTLNPDLRGHAKKIENPTDVDLKEQIRLYRGRNNKELFKLIRTISPTFKTSEVQNTPDINLKEWYVTLSHARHAIVHSLFKLDLTKVKLTKYQRQVLDHYFSYELHDDIAELTLSYEQANRTIIMIAEFGFLIFKSFSIEMNEDWRVFRDK